MASTIWVPRKYQLLLAVVLHTYFHAGMATAMSVNMMVDAGHGADEGEAGLAPGPRDAAG